MELIIKTTLAVYHLSFRQTHKADSKNATVENGNKSMDD
jgi:hypothetical protein